jgi:hypothetical protein
MSGRGHAKHCDEDIGSTELLCNKSTKSSEQNSKKPTWVLTQSLIYVILHHHRIFKGEHWDGKIVFIQISHWNFNGHIHNCFIKDVIRATTVYIFFFRALKYTMTRHTFLIFVNQSTARNTELIAEQTHSFINETGMTKWRVFVSIHKVDNAVSQHCTIDHRDSLRLQQWAGMHFLNKFCLQINGSFCG